MSELGQAVRDGRLDSVRELIAAGADVNERDPDTGSTPLHAAATLGYVHVDFTLNIPPNEPDRITHSRLPPADERSNRLEIVRVLIAAGAVVDAVDWDWGSTPLHVAAGWHHADVVGVLLESGADPTLEEKFGGTPLDLARRNLRFPSGFPGQDDQDATVALLEGS